MHARLLTTVRGTDCGSPSRQDAMAASGMVPPRKGPTSTFKRLHAATSNRSRSALVVGAVTLICVLLTCSLLRSVLLTRKAAMAHDKTDARDSVARKTLSFDACYGMANQRLSILYGVLFAVELGRTVVLPRVMVAERRDAVSNAQPATTFAHFDQIYDSQTFIDALASVGIDVLKEEDLDGVVKTEVSLNSLEDPLSDLHTKYGTVSHLHISCPLFKLKRTSFRPDTMSIAWKTLAGISPNHPAAQKFSRALRGMMRRKAFNMLHLRMEADWVQHCQQVKKGKDVNDNCMAHTDDVDKILLAYNVPTDVPLLVSSMWDQVESEKAETILARIKAAGYTVTTSREHPEYYSATDKDYNAHLDFELALQAERFIGNSVSTFSALAILQRRQAGRWAAYYNMGAMPIEAHIPAPLLPWVFAYNSFTPEDDYMVKVAVESSKPHMSLLPICLWSGDRSSHIYRWLKSQGVTMLHHEISWSEDLWIMAEPHAAHNTRRSPLYRSQAELSSDFARADVAVLPQLEQYTYILLTSPFVLFLGEGAVSLHKLGDSLPNVIGMNTAPSDDMSVAVADVLLLNLLELRGSYEEFKQFILHSRHGAYFPGYGAGASGAFAQFYEPFLRMNKVQSSIAINTGNNYNPKSLIVNFEGPKVADFLHFYRTGSCNYGNACELGLRKSVCPIIKHWQSFVNQTEDQLGVAMWYACETLYAPHLYWPKFQGVK